MTEKPEFGAVRGIYGFMGRNRGMLENSMHEDIHVIFSFSNSYSNRAYANIATRKCSRILAYNLKKTFFGFGDYNHDDSKAPRLIIYPCPRVIPENTWNALMEKASEGSVVLLTGPASFDENWANSGRIKKLGLETVLDSVAREETVLVNGKALRAVFDGQLIGWVDKETVEGAGGMQLYSFQIGKGKLLWCPLPVEMNREDSVVEEIYRIAISTAGLKSDIEFIKGDVPGIFVKKLGFKKGSIYIAVSEDGMDRDVEFTDKANGAKIDINLQSNRSVMIAVDNEGNIVDSYGIFHES